MVKIEHSSETENEGGDPSPSINAESPNRSQRVKQNEESDVSSMNEEEKAIREEYGLPSKEEKLEQIISYESSNL